MKGIILLNSSDNTGLIEEEEKSKFVRSILEELGLPLDDIWDENNQLSFESKMKLRSILGTYQIQVIDGGLGGELQIYHEHKIIGEWRKPHYISKIDHNEKDPRKKIYIEMHIDYYSIFETENNEN